MIDILKLYKLNTLSSQVANLTRSSWSWDIGVINRRRRQPENKEGERLAEPSIKFEQYRPFRKIKLQL